jgi:hypothetical protein
MSQDKAAEVVRVLMLSGYLSARAAADVDLGLGRSTCQ